MTPEDNWEGEPERECGDHRTVGRRAWCHTCSEWCYPLTPCKGCELPILRTAFGEAVWLAKLARGSSWPGEMAERVEQAAARVIAVLGDGATP